MNNIIFYATIGVAIFVLFIIWYMKYGVKTENTFVYDEENSTTVIEEQIIAEAETEPATIVIYVSGQVNNAGVYSLKEGSRVLDAVNAAGGAVETADLEALNLAALLKDADHIIVPAKGEKAVGTSGDSGEKLININTADAEELKSLPGIGDVIAGNIIKYRTKNGDFKSIEEIKNVPRIGDSIFEQIKADITV